MWRLRKRLPVDGLVAIMDTGRARLRAVGEGVKQIGQLAAELGKVEQAFAALSRVAERLAKNAPSHAAAGRENTGPRNKWPTQSISTSSAVNRRRRVDAWRAREASIVPDLTKADFCRANLSRANLDWANLTPISRDGLSARRCRTRSTRCNAD
jgi:Pentapeptide repeats (8 copies)